VPKRKDLTLDWMINNYLDFFKEFGMEEDNIRSHFEYWAQNRKPLVADFLWYTFNYLHKEIATRPIPLEIRADYNWKLNLKMYEFVRKIENRNANHLYRLVWEAKIIYSYYQSFPIKQLINIYSKGCCSYCEQFYGLQVEMDDVLKNRYIGSRHCTRDKGCSCIYTTTGARDENGRLLKLTEKEYLF
jgi:hypothetical protein